MTYTIHSRTGAIYTNAYSLLHSEMLQMEYVEYCTQKIAFTMQGTPASEDRQRVDNCQMCCNFASNKHASS